MAHELYVLSHALTLSDLCLIDTRCLCVKLPPVCDRATYSVGEAGFFSTIQKILHLITFDDRLLRHNGTGSC